MGEYAQRQRPADERDLLQEYGVRVRFIGRTEMLPEHVRTAIAEMEEVTAGNRG